MKKLTTLLLLAPIMMMSLTGCNNSEPSSTPEEAVNTVAALPNLLLRGGAVSEPNKTYPTEVGDTFTGLKSFTVDNQNVTITWSHDCGDKVTITDTKKEGVDVALITPTYPVMTKDAYLLTLTASISCQDATASSVFKFDIVSEKYEEITLQGLREKCGKSTVSLDTNYHFNGIISATVDTDEKNIKAGVYLQDGPYAIKLSDGCLKDEGGFKETWGIGTKLRVFGKVFRYNGAHYIEPETLEEVVDDTLVAPTSLVFENGDNWNKSDAFNEDGRLITVRNATYVSGKEKFKTNLNSEITFSVKDTQGNDVTVIVKFVRQLGTETLTTIKTTIDALEVGDTFDLYGVMDWNHGPKIMPMNMDGRTAVNCLVAK